MPPALVPQPLHSILLVIKTRSGPRLVLHYPPSPDAANHSQSRRPSAYDGAGNGAQGQSFSTALNSSIFSRSGADDASSSATYDQYHDSGLEFGSPSAESVANLFVPKSRGWNKKRFELQVENHTYVAYPIFEREEGGWSKAKEVEDKDNTGEGDGHSDGNGNGNVTGHRPSDSNSDEVEGAVQVSGNLEATTRHRNGPEGDGDGGDVEGGQTFQTTTPRINVPLRSQKIPPQASNTEKAPVSESFTTTATSDSIPSQASSMAAQAQLQTLAMFNLIFVLRPGQTHDDHDASLKAVYTHVVKKLAKALKWTQKRHGWLWNECKIVLGVREKGKERGVSYASIWSSIAAKSALARAVAATFDGISRGDLVHLVLGPSKSPLRLSLQIPQTMFTDLAPSPMLDQTPGLFTSTFNPSHVESFAPHSVSGAVAPYNALLLLKPKSAVISDLTANGAIQSSKSPLAQYLHHTIPTKSLLRISKTTHISLSVTQTLSAHLIQWRQAIAIPPLHSSQTYVVNPNADFSRFPEACRKYEKRFPRLPSLAIMLGKLSGTSSGRAPTAMGSAKTHGPRPYGAFIPSSDHKTAYMEILEWMMREGWVTQLRTFAWVKVSSRVKAQVARQMRLEPENLAEPEFHSSAVVFSEGDEKDPEQSQHRKHSSGGSVATPAFSPRLRALLGPPRPSSATGSSSSAKTTLRVPNLQGMGSPGDRKSNTSHGRHLSMESSASRIRLSPNTEGSEEEVNPDDFESSLVLNPLRANRLESRWLKHIGENLPSEELQTHWPKLVRHFDGRHALEEIALKEGWKRKTTTPMLLKLMREDTGVLLTVQHW